MRWFGHALALTPALSLALLAPACGGGDDGPSEPAWRALDSLEPASLLAVWGESANDVWVVGGRSALDGAPTLLRYRDQAWQRIDSGERGIDLWWVSGVPGGDVFLGGSGGTILRARGDQIERMTTPRDGIVFGIWGAAADDVWAVGDGVSGPGIVWHYDGAAWTEVAVPAETPRRVFKVHGRAANDVWISCGDGSALHWDGAAMTRETTGVPVPLFSIVTTPDEIVAVGGSTGVGQIVTRGAAAWEVASLSSPVAWRGTTARDGVVYAVGESGAVAVREAGAWRIVEQPVSQGNFHAAWIDPDGGLWAAGGDFNRSPLTADGFLTYFGTDDVGVVPP